jgi:transcription elongation factor GreB
VSIVGVDEIDLNRNYISWVSPLARALMKAAPGDCVVVRAPAGTETLEILEVRYQRISMDPFREPPGSEAAPKAHSRPGDQPLNPTKRPEDKT